jgi:2-(1,2-epoxy-1,2-dihydrophenyl)acetyl-CoA isomerase
MVNGTCAGAACDFVLSCDLSVAADDIVMLWSYILRGIAPVEGGTWLLPRRIGINRAFEILTTGRSVPAKEAFDLGILNKIVPHNQLRDAVIEYAEWYGEKGPPLAIGAARHLIYTGLQQNFRDHLDSIVFANGNVVPDRKEAMAAWVEKREPKFEGKGAER